MQTRQLTDDDLWPPNQAPSREQTENQTAKPFKGKYINVDIDAQGELLNAEQALSGRRRRKSKVQVRLPPGVCLLRKLQVQGLTKKEIEPALELWAEESLPYPPEYYYLDSWKISDHEYGLAALPAEPLRQAREQLWQEHSVRVGQVRVAELATPQDSRSGIVIWSTATGFTACLWEKGVLYDWQSFPQEIAAEFALTQLSVSCRNNPEWIYIDADAAASKQINAALISLWPEVTAEEVRDWSPQTRQRRFSANLAFDRYINEHHYQPATVKDKFRLSLAVAACVITGLFLLFTNLQQLEKQVETLRHHDSLLKVQASRSEQVAKRSGNTLRQIRELRAMTMERPGVMNALKVLSEALPPKVRLESINLERNGVVAVDGLAETEVDISSFLERLGHAPLFQNPNLTFTQKDAAQNAVQAESAETGQPLTLIRFRLETELTQPLLIVPGTEQDSDDDSAS